MEIELFDMKTGKVFKKIIRPIAEAQKFLDKCHHSSKLMILNWRYV